MRCSPATTCSRSPTNVDTFDPGPGADAHATLRGLVTDGSIFEDRIAESYRRVSELTARVT